MNLTRIYKAIDEGLKRSLIDFGNSRILKSSYVDNKLSIQDIDNWYKSGEDMSENMYKELCKDAYIGFYIIKDINLLHKIFSKITFKNINLNWINISELNEIWFHDDEKNYKYSLDILYWDIIKIPGYAFAECSSLVSIEIPDSVTSIGYCAFSNCSSLVTIEIPDSVTYIPNYAFEYCVALSSIKIPDSITVIDYLAFYGCSQLNSINYGGTMYQWQCIKIDRDNKIFRKYDTKLEYDYRAPVKEIICTDGIIGVQL